MNIITVSVGIRHKPKPDRQKIKIEIDFFREAKTDKNSTLFFWAGSGQLAKSRNVKTKEGFTAAAERGWRWSNYSSAPNSTSKSHLSCNMVK